MSGGRMHSSRAFGNPGSVSRRLLSYAAVTVIVVAVVVTIVVIMMRTPGPNPPDDQDAFARIEEETEALSPDQRPQIEVLNGCGITGIAATVHEYLRDKGFDVVNVENASGFDYEETLVIDRGGDIRVARALARDLGTDNVIRQVRADLVLQATVILGMDYRTLKPFQDGP